MENGVKFETQYEIYYIENKFKSYDFYSFVLGGNNVPYCKNFVCLDLPIGNNELCKALNKI